MSSVPQHKRREEARDDARETRGRPAVVPGPASTRNEPAREPAAADAAASKAEDGVVDAEFEEVKDDEKK